MNPRIEESEFSASVHAHVDDLPEAARHLMQTDRTGNLYTDPQWHCLLQQEVLQPQGAQCRYLCLHRNVEPILVLPLMRRPVPSWPSGAEAISVKAFRPALAARARQLVQGPLWESLGNYYTGLWEPAHAHDLDNTQSAHAFVELLRRLPPLLGNKHRQLRLALGPMAQDHLLLPALQGAGWQPRVLPAFGNWHEPIAPGSSFAQYWQARPGELRSTAARAARRFARAGGEIQIVDTQRSPHRALPAALIDAYKAVYAQSWKPPEAQANFIPKLLQWTAQRGWLRLGLAWLQGCPVAAHIWFVLHGRAEIFKLAYVQDAATYSPGTLLGQALMQHVMDVDGVQEVDYLSGDDGYKRMWMGHRRQRVQVTVRS